MLRRTFLVAALLLTAASAQQPDADKITHSFLALGGHIRLIDDSGKVTWSYPGYARDGWVLPSGNILLAMAGKPGEIVELTRDNQVVFSHKGTQDEVDTVQRLRDGHTVFTEAGQNPRLLELDAAGNTVKELPSPSQRENTHMQQRMSRKLRNGNYLVPHLQDRIVREYNPEGKEVWSVKTPNMPFTAIRLDNGNTLIGCTLGNLVIEVDPKGEIVWQVSNDDFPSKPFNDCCGVQRLPNGNTVISSYRAPAGAVRLTEVTRDKKIVWTWKDDMDSGIHHFQILDTNGEPLKGRPLR